jgi:hypothetical protein
MHGCSTNLRLARLHRLRARHVAGSAEGAEMVAASAAASAVGTCLGHWDGAARESPGFAWFLILAGVECRGPRSVPLAERALLLCMLGNRRECRVV